MQWRCPRPEPFVGLSSQRLAARSRSTRGSLPPATSRWTVRKFAIAGALWVRARERKVGQHKGKRHKAPRREALGAVIRHEGAQGAVFASERGRGHRFTTCERPSAVCPTPPPLHRAKLSDGCPSGVGAPSTQRGPHSRSRKKTRRRPAREPRREASSRRFGSQAEPRHHPLAKTCAASTMATSQRELTALAMPTSRSERQRGPSRMAAYWNATRRHGNCPRTQHTCVLAC